MNITQNVENLYNKYPFPGINNFINTVIPNKITKTKNGIEIPCIGISHLPDILHYIFNGKWDKNKVIRILFAGGGTGQHTYWLAKQLKYNNYKYEIIHFELSEKAIEQAKQNLNKYGLTGIHFVKGSLLELDKFNLGKFDYIDCYGVLHHTSSPLDCLMQLEKCLYDDGGMGIMLYGKYGRKGIYSIQNIMKQFNKNLDEKIDLFKHLLPNIPNSNDFDKNNYINDSWSKSKENITDTLLHVQDIPFTIDMVYDLCNKANMEIIDFTNKYLYNPDTYFKNKNDNILIEIKKLSKIKQQIICEQLVNTISRHEFFIKKKSNKKHTIITLDNKIDYKYIKPIKRADVTHPGGNFELNITNCIYNFGYLPEITNDILNHIDNNNTIIDIYNKINSKYKISKEDYIKKFKQFYNSFDQLGWIVLEYISIFDENKLNYMKHLYSTCKYEELLILINKQLNTDLDKQQDEEKDEYFFNINNIIYFDKLDNYKLISLSKRGKNIFFIQLKARIFIILRRYNEACNCLQESFYLKRGSNIINYNNLVIPIKQHKITTKAVLEYNIEYLNYLITKKKLIKFENILSVYEDTLKKVNHYNNSSYLANISLDEPYMKDIKQYYNRPIYIKYDNEVISGELFNEIDFVKKEEEYFNSDIGVVIIDNILSDNTIQLLRKIIKENAIFFDYKFPNLFKSRMDDGLHQQIFGQIANELQKKMPKLLSIPLKEWWIYKSIYKPQQLSLGIHTDSGLVQVNFWITEENYNLNKQSGGLIIYKTQCEDNDESSLDWDINVANGKCFIIDENGRSIEPKKHELLKNNNYDSIKIPYKENRAIIFNSSLFHTTDSKNINFANDYSGFRANLTYTFGDRL